MKHLPANDELLDLMSLQAVEGLSDIEAMKLEHLLAEHPECETIGLELAAAALDLASLPAENPPLPKRLRDRILENANNLESTQKGLSRRQDDLPSRARFPYEWVIAAAAVLVAILAWLPKEKTANDDPNAPWSYDQVAEVEDAKKSPWVAKEPKYDKVKGEVVWSKKVQRGVMKFDGLPENDPKVAQYQLWIVDPSRDEKPIDGGVFNVKDGVAEIPVDAKLQIDNAAAFAVTLEKPGGVVVSKGPLLIVATL